MLLYRYDLIRFLNRFTKSLLTRLFLVSELIDVHTNLKEISLLQFCFIKENTFLWITSNLSDNFQGKSNKSLS